MAAAAAAAESTVCLMDNLWFNRIILFSQLPPPQHHKISPRQLIKDDVSTKETDCDLDQKETAAANDLEIERPTTRRLDLSASFAEGGSHSSSSSAPKRSGLKKSSSLKSLVELELEEVKGFMDLGFNFGRENLSKRIIHLVPGLQRLSSDEDEDEERKGVIRPYLSEAWIARRPQSPLMSFKNFPSTVSTAADMKKHLRFWAQTVASAIHQES